MNAALTAECYAGACGMCDSDACGCPCHCEFCRDWEPCDCDSDSDACEFCRDWEPMTRGNYEATKTSHTRTARKRP